MTAAPAHQIIRNGLLLDPERRTVEAADVLIAGDEIAETGAPGMDRRRTRSPSTRRPAC